jgi:hypothetical protein
VTRLAVTARCGAELASLEDDEAEALLAKFVDLRGQAPDEGEPILGLWQRPCKSLHAGRYRGATWYDTQHDVVWFLFAGIHRADSREDAYNRAIALEQSGLLYPTEVDYFNLQAQGQRDQLAEEAQALASLRDQLLHSGQDQTLPYTSPYDLYAEISAQFIEELAEVMLRIRLFRATNQPLRREELEVLLARVFPDRPVEEQPERVPRFRCFTAYFQRSAHYPPT